MSEVVLIEYQAKIDGLTAQLNAMQAQMKKTESAGKAAAQGTSKEFQKAGSEIKGALNDIAATIGVAFGAAQVFNFGKESVKAFLEAEENAKRLAFAVKSIGGEGQLAFKKLIDQSAKLQENSIFSDDDIQRAQTALVQYGLTSDQVENLIPKILDLASAQGLDLAQATDKVISGINGQTKGLKEAGIAFEDTGSKTENLALLSDKLTKFQGATADALETTAGKAKRLENAIGDFQETLGELIINEGNQILDFFDLFSDGFDKVFNRLGTGALTKALNEANVKILESAKASEAARTKAVAESSVRIIALTQKLQDTRSNLEFNAVNEMLKNEKRLNDELRNLNNQRTKVRDDQTAKGKAASDKQAEDAKKAAEASAKFWMDAEMEAAREANESTEVLKNASNKIKEYLKANDKEVAENAAKTAKEITDNDRKAAEERTKIAKEEAEAKKAYQDRVRDAAFSAVSDGLNSIAQIEANNNERALQEIDGRYSTELSLLEQQLATKQITEEEYNRKKTELTKKQQEEEANVKRAAFESQKQAALIQAVISIAQGVAKTIGELGFPAAIPFIALAAAQGALQIAAIESQPTPKFAKGVVGLKGKGTKTSDEIPAWLSNGESVITADATAQHKDLLIAMNKGKAKDYIYRMLIAPALAEQKQKFDRERQTSFADNLAKSIMQNSKGFYDGNLLDSLKNSRKSARQDAEMIAKAIRNGSYNPRKW